MAALMEFPQPHDQKQNAQQDKIKNSPRRTSSETQQQRCQQCNMTVSIYQCPRCSIRTCSLQCCQGHKQRTGCSGKRDRSEFLPLCHMTDTSLRSDYFFLEEVLDQMPRARKISKMEHADSSHVTNKNKHQTTNKKSRRLVQQAEKRGITLQTLPSFMERHQSNTSWYCGPRDTIMWKVDCIRVPRNEKVSFILSEHEEAILDHILQRMPQKDDDSDKAQTEYKLFLKRPSPANQPRYIELDPNQCLNKALQGLTIIEHPTVYCVPKEEIYLKDFPTGTNMLVEHGNTQGTQE